MNAAGVVVRAATMLALVGALALAPDRESLMIVVGAIIVVSGGRVAQAAVAAKRAKEKAAKLG